MRRHRLLTATIPCPVPLAPDSDDLCGQPLTVTLSPYHPGTRDDPPEGPDIEDIDGTCEHVETVDWEMVYDAAIDAAREANELARDAAIDQRIHLMLEGDD